MKHVDHLYALLVGFIASLFIHAFYAFDEMPVSVLLHVFCDYEVIKFVSA